jgi:hypothetical protein
MKTKYTCHTPVKLTCHTPVKLYASFNADGLQDKIRDMMPGEMGELESRHHDPLTGLDILGLIVGPRLVYVNAENVFEL